jgi:hypothetical protein
VVAADVHVFRRVARLHVELARRLGDLLEDPVGVELDELALDLLAGARNSSSASGFMNSTPSSETMRRQPRSSDGHRVLERIS